MISMQFLYERDFRNDDALKNLFHISATKRYYKCAEKSAFFGHFQRFLVKISQKPRKILCNQKSLIIRHFGSIRHILCN